VAKLRITWIRSGIGRNRSQRQVLRALGFHRLNQSIAHDDCAVIRGMIGKVKHLVKVEGEDS